MATSKTTKTNDTQLNARSSKVNRQLHIIGLGISIVMFLTTLILLGGTIYSVYIANRDLVNGTVSYITMSSINRIVAWVLLMMVTLLTAFVFFRLYRAYSPFSRGNIFIIRVVAIILMLLSVLPIVVQTIVASFFGISIELSINFMYIFIGVIFYSISYIFEHGEIIQKKTDDKIDVQEEIILDLAELTEAKSGQTGQHIKRISEYCRILAENMGMSEHEVETIRIASMMHDVGKLLIPNEILEKESSLTDEEFAIMKTHVIAGEKLLHNAKGEIMEEARKMALEHHEEWDGSGYLGKKGEEISLSARIVSVADVFDSLVSARSYKTGWDPNKVYSLIVDESGKKFDPDIIKVFIRCYQEMLKVYHQFNNHTIKEEEYVSEYSDKLEILNEYQAAKTADTQPEISAYQDVELDLRRLI